MTEEAIGPSGEATAIVLLSGLCSAHQINCLLDISPCIHTLCCLSALVDHGGIFFSVQSGVYYTNS